METEFPPNSNSEREPRRERSSQRAPEAKQETRQVTKHRVSVRKRSLWRKFMDAFRPEDNVGFAEHALLEIIAPGIKDAFGDAIHSTVDNALGGGHTTSRRRGGGRGYTSYSSMSTSRPRRGRDDDDRRDRRDRSASLFDLRDVTFESRAEAEEVLDILIEMIDKYDVATMRDLLGLIGERHNHVDEDWGWTDLRGSRIHRVGRDYLLDLPRPDELRR